jgi:hypothetical protein
MIRRSDQLGLKLEEQGILLAQGLALGQASTVKNPVLMRKVYTFSRNSKTVVLAPFHLLTLLEIYQKV